MIVALNALGFILCVLGLLFQLFGAAAGDKDMVRWGWRLLLTGLGLVVVPCALGLSWMGMTGWYIDPMGWPWS